MLIQSNYYLKNIGVPKLIITKHGNKQRLEKKRNNFHFYLLLYIQQTNANRVDNLRCTK